MTIPRAKRPRRRKLEIHCRRPRCYREQRIYGECKPHARVTADTLFARYIRARDKKCAVCGIGPAAQCMHGFSRRYFATRWDPENAWGGCAACHMRMTNDPLGWTDWMIGRMGPEVYASVAQKARMGGMPDLGLVIEQFRDAA